MTRRLGEVRRLGFALVLAMAVTGSADAEPDGLRRALDHQQQDLKTQSDENRHRGDSQRDQLHQQQEGTLGFQLRQQDRPLQPSPPPPPSQPPSITCTQVGVTFFCR